jgi:CRISPR-associated protein Csb1
MSELLTKYDIWLQQNGPAALVIREHLMPVEGPDGVVFPATFAASEDKTFKGGYNIDELPNGKNICLIDSVGSQANRIEPLFINEPYAKLIPQVTIKAGDKTVNLLEAGHRAGDAIIRCSALKEQLQNAFKDAQKGNMETLAKIAPTSLVFGVWDSRDTQAKLPRLIASTIRAFDVRKLTRSAVYIPAAEYVNQGLLDEPEDKASKDNYAVRGFVHVPASAAHGGVIADGGIRRDASLHLAALRLLRTGNDKNESLKLQRYVLGLALTAFTCPWVNYLRQGCNLVFDPDKGREFVAVFGDGKRDPISISHDDALEFAKKAAETFGIGADQAVEFSKELAKEDIGGESGKKQTKAAGKKANNRRLLCPYISVFPFVCLILFFMDCGRGTNRSGLHLR